jgi:hypothetical protein
MALIEIGKVLVDGEEFAERAGEFDKFVENARAAQRKGKLGDEAFRFEAGKALARDLRLEDSPAPKVRGAGQPAEVEFEPIGIGRPLSIEILHVYAGDLPTTVLRRTPDVLVTSAARAWTVAEAAPRALNRLAKDVGRRQVVDFPAVGSGSRLVFYSKAMTEDSTSVTVELVADSFPDEAFQQLSGLLGKAAGLPVFASASLYLTAGSLLTRALGALGEKLVDGRPFFADTLDILFSTAGVEAAQSHKALLVNRGTEPEFRGKYEFPPGSYELVSTADGRPYQGPAPYVAVAIDGHRRVSYESFAPALATAALLDRFHHLSGSDGQLAETLYGALELYNDVAFAKKAEQARADLEGATPGSEEHARAQKLLAACLENIRNEAIRKSAAA